MTLAELHEGRRKEVRDLIMTRRKKARNAKNSEIPELDGGTSKASSGLPDVPNVQTMVSDLVPHSV